MTAPGADGATTGSSGDAAAPLRIGVLELQGDFAEHEAALARCGVRPIGVRRREDLVDDASGRARVDALVLPGGESTTIGKLLVDFGMLEPLRALISAQRLPVFGTCAGCILLAREIRGRPEQTRLGVLDVEVERNAHGPQIDSFECDVASDEFRSDNGGPLRATHIRAPAIIRVLSGKVRVLATHRERPIIVQQGLLLASTFHPELTTDTRVHQHFIAMGHGTFRELFAGRLPEWLTRRLEALHFGEPTEVQRVALDALLPPRAGDAVVHAETGSGKTLAYLLPLLAAVEPSRSAVQGLVIAPTRELAAQIYQVARQLAAGFASADGATQQRVAPAHGGHGAQRTIRVALLRDDANARRQRALLRESPPRVVVGTPQRLRELAEQERALRLHSVNFAVVDEVDASLLEPAFRADLHELLTVHCRSQIGESRRTVFASATLPQHHHVLERSAQEKWLRPEQLEHLYLSRDVPVPERIEHRVAVCRRPRLSKLSALARMLRAELGADAAAADAGAPPRVLIFFRESRPLPAIRERLAAALGGVGDARIVHLAPAMGGRARRASVAAFRDGSAQILLATDLAARGLDFADTTHVVNFDMPASAEDYLHRAGRTARGNRPGRATTLVAPDEAFALDRFANKLDIVVAPLRIRGSDDEAGAHEQRTLDDEASVPDDAALGGEAAGGAGNDGGASR